VKGVGKGNKVIKAVSIFYPFHLDVVYETQPTKGFVGSALKQSTIKTNGRMTVVVIDHNPHWTDAERKNKEKFWMHRLKSFRPDGMNKQIDAVKMNV
jgi:hypothetical protein